MSADVAILTDELREAKRLLAALFQGAITPDSSDLLTDEQLRAKFPGMSKSKFDTILRDGPARGQHRMSRNFSLIEHFFIGKKRYWKLSSYVDFVEGRI